MTLPYSGELNRNEADDSKVLKLIRKIEAFLVWPKCKLGAKTLEENMETFGDDDKTSAESLLEEFRKMEVQVTTSSATSDKEGKKIRKELESLKGRMWHLINNEEEEEESVDDTKSGSEELVRSVHQSFELNI